MARVTGHVYTERRRRGDVWYMSYRYASGKQERKLIGDGWEKREVPPSGYFRQKDAEDVLADKLTELRKGEVLDPGRRSGRTFGEAVKAWLSYVEHEKARRSSTVRGYRGVANLLEEEFGEDTPLEEITTEKIDTYRRRLLDEGKVTRRTIQQRFVLLHGLLRRAVANDWLSENPADRVERVNVPRNEEFNVLTVEQVQSVARAAEETFAAAITLAALAGLRAGELRALRWRDVDFSLARLTVWRNHPAGGEETTPKSGKGRPVPLMDQAARVLDRLSRRESFTEPDDRVFCTESGKALSDDALRDAFYDAMASAGIDRKAFPAKGGFVFHDLRHTFATVAAQLGSSLIEIKAWMGHADISTTMIYAHYIPQRDAAARLTKGVEELSETVYPAEYRTAERRA